MRAGQLKTLFGFFVLPMISMIAALVAIPVLITTGGTSAWSAVAIAQGIGSIAAIFITFGWGTVGPAEVGRSTLPEQRHIYWLSVLTRGGLLLVSAPIAVLVTVFLVTPSHLPVAVVVTIAISLQGMAPGWFLIGQGRPMAIAAMETGPRAVSQLISVAVVVGTQEIIWYGVISLSMELVIATTAALTLGTRSLARGASAPQIADSLRRQWPLALAALVGSGYTRAAVPIVSAVSHPAVAVFASLDRVQLLARTGLRPVISFFQGWVVRGEDRAQEKRSMVAMCVTIGFGVIVGSTVAVLLPPLGHLLFTDKISVSSLQALWLGLTIVAVSVSYSTGLYYLVPRRAIKVLSMSSVFGTLVGVPALFMLTQQFGATGAIAAIAGAETVVVLWHVSYLLAVRAGRKD
jgi:O-antigen/teichoic acid export membrane protein